MSTGNHRAPMTLAIILELNKLRIDNGVTQEKLAERLNVYLPDKKKITGHTGQVKINRWLNPTSEHWAEPRAEIILAMEKVINDLSK